MSKKIRYILECYLTKKIGVEIKCCLMFFLILCFYCIYRWCVNFTQAGINQTLHQLTMSVLVDVSVLVLGETASFTVTSEVVVAETVIVGDVPDTFFQAGGTYGSQTKNQGIN